jgi:serine/threonine protein kinase
MFDFSLDESEEIQRLESEVSRMKEEYLLRFRKLYLFQIELEKKLHFLHEEKLALSDQLEKLDNLTSQVPCTTFHQAGQRDFSFSNYGTEESFLSLGDLEENAKVNKVPNIVLDYQNQQMIEIPYIFLPNRTGYEVTRDFPIVVGEIIAEKYRIDRIISNTQTSCILSCQDLSKRLKVCVKVIQNDKRSFERGLNELRVLTSLKKSCRDLSHFNVIKLFDYFYHKEHLFIIQELGFQTLAEFSVFKLKKNLPGLRQFSIEILKALDLLHSNGIIHCDLNPENILIHGKVNEEEVHYRLIDFNSAITPEDKELHTYPLLAYAAPELSESKFTQALDIWSFGLILLEFYLGFKVFNPMSELELLFYIQEAISPIPGKVIQKDQLWEVPQSIQNFYLEECEEFQDFITKILNTDYKRRISAKDALRHAWLIN